MLCIVHKGSAVATRLVVSFLEALQVRITAARHQTSLSFPGSTNVGHEPSQGGSTLDGFGSRDLWVFAEAKPSNPTALLGT